MWITIIQISKKEAADLGNIGYRFGNYGMIHRTKSRNPKYYLTEDYKALKDLERIRKSKIAK